MFRVFVGVILCLWLDKGTNDLDRLFWLIVERFSVYIYGDVIVKNDFWVLIFCGVGYN